MGDEIPPREELAKLPVRKTGPNTLDRRPNELTRFDLLRASERELPQDRVRRLGIKLEPFQKPPLSGGRPLPWVVRAYLWRSLDTDLERDFDMA